MAEQKNRLRVQSVLSSDDHEPGYKTFSEMNSLGDLLGVFGMTVRVRGTETLCSEQGGSLSKYLSDMQPADFTAVTKLYRALFDHGDGLERVRLPPNLPDFLKPLFRHMVFCRNRRPPEPQFNNGAGKQWGSCVMEMRRHVGIGKEWGVKASTTSSTRDWCGMRASNISGVVDFLVENVDARVLAVGGVNSEVTAQCQVLAPLLLQREKQGVCPVGFTINEHILTIFQLVPDGGATQPTRYALRPHPIKYITFQRKPYLTQSLSDVIHFIDDLLVLTANVEQQLAPPELELQATPLDSDTEDAGTNRPRDIIEQRLSEVEEFSQLGAML
ncbi:hypothetical protein GBAR_LOCUS25138 [Geodia barretti]|uniref:Uncharacterized protein n=1 Tax=Geodia barretti TaxID=519541 RepID=A0AA35X5Y4_GEOBA|nr:hypothetical protein GBAR_LOCUS25138 [Geodia barretti]